MSTNYWTCPGAVDTLFSKLRAEPLSQRLGFTRHTEPNLIEQDLMKLLPRETWTRFSHGLVYHGRAVCLARTPKCADCPAADLCPFPGQ